MRTRHYNKTPKPDIFKIAKEGTIREMKIAILQGADINAEDRFQLTPIIHAIWYNNRDIFDYLLANGAKIAYGDNERKPTPLHICASRINRHLTYQRYTAALIAKGAKLDIQDNIGMMPLHCAAIHGNQTMVQILLKAGANINALDTRGYTALHCAILAGNTAIAKDLINSGSDLNTVDNDGNTPIVLAAKFMHKEIMQALIEKGAKFSAQNQNGLTVLDALQTSNDKLEFMQML